MKKHILLLLLFFWAGVHIAAPVRNSAAPNTTMIQPCDLPAPQNLRTTVISPTSITFVWDVVVGSAGYDYELVKVSNGQMIAAGHALDESYVATGLQPNTLYRMTVWSVCKDSQRGGSSSREVKTDFVIIDDVIVSFPAGTEIVGNDFEIFRNGPVERFIAKSDDQAPQPATLFEVVKYHGTPGSSSVDDYISHVRHGNGESGPWMFANQEGVAPGGPIKGLGNSSFVEAEFVYVFHGGNDPVIKITIYKNTNGTGTSTLHWDALAPGFSVVMVAKNAGRQLRTGNTMLSDKASVSDGAYLTPDESEGLKIGPNPFTNDIQLHRNAPTPEPATIHIYDLNGHELFRQDITSQDAAVQLVPDGLKDNGVYLLKYETATSIRTFRICRVN